MTWAILRPQSSARSWEPVSTMRVAPALAAAFAGVTLLASGCGGSNAPAVASLSTTSVHAAARTSPASSSSAQSGSSTGLVAFAACMRSHGVPSFPDPKPGGGFDLKGAGINRLSPQVESANKACAGLQPGGAKTPAQIRQHIKVLRAVAECMRAHGVPYFPDPNSQGSIVSSSSQWDPSSPQFQTAQKICAHLNPGTG
jgi:hypothetical protein